MGKFFGFKAGVLAMLLSAMAVPATASLASTQSVTLTPDNLLVLRGEVTDASMGKLMHAVLAKRAQAPLYLYIDSPGGSVSAGMDFIKAVKVSNVRLTCIANTAISMAFAILQEACAERLIVDTSVLMQHMVSYGLEGPEPHNYTMASFIHSMSYDLYRRQATRLGMTFDQFYVKIRDDWWMWGNESIVNKAADRIVEVKCSQQLLNSFTEETVRVLFFTIKLRFNGCPVISTPILMPAGPAEEKARNTPEFHDAVQRVLDTFNARSLADKWLKTRTFKIPQ